MLKIKDYATLHPTRDILSIQMFACHGMIFNGNQVVLINNYDKTTNFYEFIQPELYIR